MANDGPRGWGAPLHAAVLDATAVGSGTSLLDLGCGAGLFARAAADRGARVTGIDADPVAVALAAQEVPGASFTVGDVHAPPAGRFDVVTAVQVLPHVPDPVEVLSVAGRSGAVVAATGWGREDECDVRVVGEALVPWLGTRPARRQLGDPAALCSLAERAGLAVDHLGEVVCAFEYPDDHELLGSLLDSGPGRAAARTAGPAAVAAALIDRLRPYRTATGGYRLENLFRVLVGRRA